ncbi:hypothetical protein [Fictibacillus terranigra]|uniref:Uncharacterized protein n=1 Tax=Fictibacillus terranigra TaxID=3058424 RepID=A0ABT8EDT9_9BACL|nr:hypothetical protein [Fictibacillus sp. CENA-BCM004]MDN4073864.1 hypothetical protein [Fictibacillus sp. CENA-BCM004]MDN4076055.1 hypothetical protein [Fictibacillus sp. CENA-BCM004]
MNNHNLITNYVDNPQQGLGMILPREFPYWGTAPSTGNVLTTQQLQLIQQLVDSGTQSHHSTGSNPGHHPPGHYKGYYYGYPANYGCYPVNCGCPWHGWI